MFSCLVKEFQSVLSSVSSPQSALEEVSHFSPIELKPSDVAESVLQLKMIIRSQAELTLKFNTADRQLGLG